MAPAPDPPPSLQQAVAQSTTVWQNDLQQLFDHAKQWFPDVVWDVTDEDQPLADTEEVWGHKAIIYARAPPSFQARYFSFRPAPLASPTPYSASTTPLPAQSSFSLALPDFSSRSPSPFRAASPSPSQNMGNVMRIPASFSSALFTKELEYLYTGKGLGEAFEFLFDSTEPHDPLDESARVDKLRKDLVFMWRSRLYSDVRIALEGTFSSTNHETTMALFSSHRFVLVARSPYFASQFLNWTAPPPKDANSPLTVTLPSPPFTPASMHFTLGYIYTGTLVFSHRTFDLDTAFAILRASLYLSLESLHSEIQARLVQEMLHGLFHAFLDFAEYERVTGGKWGVGGCRCRQCARRAPRVLEFALAEDVKNQHLERGARRALVGLFGEGWCNAEFTQLPQKIRDSLVKGVGKRTTPQNVIALLSAAQHALEKLDGQIDAWADVSRDMILTARKTIDRVLCDELESCLEQDDFVDLLVSDGARFDDMDRLAAILDSIRRGLVERNAPSVYQTLVSSILLRAHPDEEGETMLGPNSGMREAVEALRLDVTRWLKRRWIQARQENAFEELQDWALKEISHEIDVPVDDLLAPTSVPHARASVAHNTRARLDSDSISVQSFRSAASSRRPRESLTSDTASVRSARTAASRATTRKGAANGSRPDSKLTPANSSASVTSSRTSRASTAHASSTLQKSTSGPAAQRQPSNGNGSVTEHGRLRTKSSTAASVTSVRSRASTVRKSSAGTTTTSMTASTATTGSSVRDTPSPREARPESTASTNLSVPDESRRPGSNVSANLSVHTGGVRPDSTFSTTSDASSSFKTASEASTPLHRLSTASLASAASSKGPKSPARSPVVNTPTRSPVGRRASPASTTASTVTTSVSVASSRRRVTPTSSEPTGRNGMGRTVSMASTRSSVSVRSTASGMVKPKKPAATEKGSKTPSTASSRGSSATDSPARLSLVLPSAEIDVDAGATIKAKSSGKKQSDGAKLSTEAMHTATSPTTSTEDLNDHVLKRKSSADTIKETRPSPVSPLVHHQQGREDEPEERLPRGATLEVGIPCIISSNRARFRALARYIGEVEGEAGPWVGVEVPLSESTSTERLEGRAWHDGTWGGVRYFDLNQTSEWEGEERAWKRRYGSIMMGASGGLKREGDMLSISQRSKRFRSESPAMSDAEMTESRGLFVRPQQVLYVVDAIGDL